MDKRRPVHKCKNKSREQSIDIGTSFFLLKRQFVGHILICCGDAFKPIRIFSSLISCFSRFCLLVSLLLAIMAQGTISLAILILGSCYLLSSHLIQNPFSLQEQAILANAKLSDLPFRMQVALRRRPKTGDNSWVMIYYKINTMVETLNQSLIFAVSLLKDSNTLCNYLNQLS